MTSLQKAARIGDGRGIVDAISSTVLVSFLVLTLACSRSNQSSSTHPAPSKDSSTVKSASDGESEFEGLVTLCINTAEKKDLELTYFIKGSLSRVESKFDPNSNLQSIILCNASAGKITTLMPKRKLFMTMDLDEERNGPAKRGIQNDPSVVDKQKGEFPSLTATGKREFIAGYPCDHWLMGDKAETDMCVAKGLGYLGMGNKLGGLGSLKNLFFNPHSLSAEGIRPEWREFLRGGAFPLKVTQTENGVVRINIEATKIERKKLDSNLFLVPADYREMRIPNPLRQ